VSRHWIRPALLGLSLSLVASAVQAQGEHRFGLIGGVNFAKVAGNGANQLDDVSNRTGFLAGAFGELSVSRNVALSLEAFYTRKGSKVTDGGTDIDFKIDYVEVPVLLKLVFPSANPDKTRIRPHLYVGPAVAFRTSCKARGEDGNIVIELNCAEDPFDAQVKKTDFSILFGAGLDIGPIFVGARYDYGMVDLNDDPLATDQDALKTRTMSIVAGVSFPLKRK
jgi:hypothetical protein